MAFADYVRTRELQGQAIIKMQTGDPDFATHPSIVRAATKALSDGQTKYCDSRGLPSLRKAIACKLAVSNGINVDASQILVTHGAVHGVAMAIRTLVNAGDEVIILEPYWRAYEANVILAGGEPIIVSLDPSRGFTLDAEVVLAHVTSRTTLIVVNSPNNPSGAVYAETELRKLARGAAACGVYLLCDEVYEGVIFEGGRHFSPASDPEVFNNTLSVFSFSKTHAMTGWRLGYLVANAELISEMLKLSQFAVTSLSPFTQIAAIHALQSHEVALYAEEMRAAYESRRDHIFACLSNTWLASLAVQPDATFYVLFNMKHLGLSSLELAKRIVDECGIAFTPGIAFGDHMDGYLRMCFATSNENIESAIRALIGTESCA